MPSVNYMNQSAPFWDWVASLEQQGQTHPFFSGGRNDDTRRSEERQPNPSLDFGPWGWGFPGFGGRAFAHRGPPPPPGPAPHHDRSDEKDHEREKEKEGEDNDNGEGPSAGSGSDREGCPRGRRGRCGGRRGRPSFGPYGHHGHGGFGPRHGPPHHHGRREGWGLWSRGGPFTGPFNPWDFAAGLFDPENKHKKESEDFEPEADIFDTESAFVVHVSLPGAKKEDVGVNWDAEKSELSIAGVVYRPGGEEFLKTLAMDERKVGPFERKIRLGTRANPAQIDADAISAKLEDGVLRIEVPKLDTGFVEVRKVDVE